MTKTSKLVLASVLAAIAVPVGAQSLGDAARREKERRTKSRAAPQPAKTYTDQDLSGLPGPQPEAARGGAATAGESGASASSSTSGSGEAYWRQRAAHLRDDVRRAEKRVADARAQVDQAGPWYADPEVCQEGTPVGSGVPRSGSVELRDSAKGSKVCHGQGSASARAEAQQELERAQAELTSAQAALSGLDEEARRGGAQPGWIR